MARKSAEIRREELIEAAVRVLLRDGVNGATTRAIAAEAGAALASVHYCFNSREELLEAAGRRMTDQAATYVRDAFIHRNDLRATVAGLLNAFWAGVEDRPEAELVSYELRQYALRQPDMRELAHHQLAHYLEVFEELLQLVADKIGIAWTVPIDVLARYIHSSLDGLSLTWLVDQDSARSHQVLELMTDYVVNCAQTPPRPTRDQPEHGTGITDNSLHRL